MKLFIVFLACIAATSSLAHPTSYEGSTGLMSYNQPDLNLLELNYSWKYWFATSVRHLNFNKDFLNKEARATYASLNFLAYRHNTDKLQANLYLAGGAGVSNIDTKSKDSGFGLAQFDIEDRKFYFLAKHQVLFDKEDYELQISNVRAGMAPYVAPADGIHSWLILEYLSQNFRNFKTSEDLGPLLRVFYKNLLFEVGYTFKGLSKFNFISHF